MSTWDTREICGGVIVGGMPRKVLGKVEGNEEVLNEHGEALRREHEELFGAKAVRPKTTKAARAASEAETAPTPALTAAMGEGNL